VPEPLIRYAQEFAEVTLGTDSPLYLRGQVAASQAQLAATSLGRPRPEVLVAAAWLHAIGEAPDAARTGLVSVDGATFLLANGWPEPVISLVAHQLQSRMLAETYGAADSLALIERVQGWPADIVDYAVITTGDQEAVSVDQGLQAIWQVAIAERRLSPALREERQGRLRRAADRVQSAIAAAGGHAEGVNLPATP